MPTEARNVEERLEGRSEFWEQLVSAGVLDSALADEYQQLCSSDWTPLGKLLINRGALSMGQLMGLLAMQVDEAHVRLGDLAVREGICTKEQVLEALAEQRTKCPHPIEVLLKDARVDNGLFFGPLIEYVRWLEAALHRSRVTLVE